MAINKYLDFDARDKRRYTFSLDEALLLIMDRSQIELKPFLFFTLEDVN